MRYVSTRGAAPAVGFDDVLTSALAPDGGLYLPEYWPKVDIDALRQCGSYAETTAAILAPFLGGSVLLPALKDLTKAAYADFRHPQVAPLTSIGGDWLLELFWGPTLSFKDYALQVVARMLDEVLVARGRSALVLGATSGDTGSAAMEACRDRPSIAVVILYPAGRISEFQRRQMTTIPSDNVRAVAVEGTFDDCQDLVKAVFTKPDLQLVALNSINWGRVAAQTAFYAWATLQLQAFDGLAFAVPTGNFGNVLAGYAAEKMGIPIRQLILANNANNGLAELITNGAMSLRSVEPTLAPAMDIQVPSNLERLLFDLTRQPVTELMKSFREEGRLEINVGDLFAAGYRTDEQIVAAIAEAEHNFGIVLDPHTAVGWSVGSRQRIAGVPLVSIATAHPAKFADAIERAIGYAPLPPPDLADLGERPERFTTIPNDIDALMPLLAG